MLWLEASVTTDPKAVRLALSVVSGRETVEVLSRADLELLGFSYYSLIEHGWPDQGAVQFRAEEIVYRALCPEGE